MNLTKLVSPFLFAITLFGATGASAQNDSELHSTVQVSFFPPLSTNGHRAGLYTNDISLNLLAGVSKNERALALAGLANVIKNDADGAQIAGLLNYTGGEGRGLQWAGLANVVRGDHTGLQWAGLANVVRGDDTGLQWAGLANIVRGDHTGLQWAGLVNTANSLQGFQTSGLANIAADVKGVQIAGLVNVSQDVAGVQIGGLVNVAKRVRGVQFAGLVNIAEESDYPIGIVNIIKRGEMGVAVGYNEIGTSSITFRSGGGVFYGILGFGYNHKAPAKEAASIIGGYGAHINILPWLRINNELTMESLGVFSKKDTFKAGYALLPAFRPWEHIEIFGGPSLNFMQSNEENMFDIFPDNYFKRRTITTNDGGPKLQQAFVGWQVGVQYIF